MKKEIRDMVANCQTCEQQKYETLAPVGLIHPLPIPSRMWSNISIDFIIGLPPCRGKTVIWVVIDRLSKYGHFVLLSHRFTSTTVTNLFVEHIFKLNGIPIVIFSDTDHVFMSAFWKEFFAL